VVTHWRRAVRRREKLRLYWNESDSQNLFLPVHGKWRRMQEVEKLHAILLNVSWKFKETNVMEPVVREGDEKCWILFSKWDGVRWTFTRSSSTEEQQRKQFSTALKGWGWDEGHRLSHRRVLRATGSAMASVIFPRNMKQSLYMQFMWQDCDTCMEITIRGMKGEKYVWNGEKKWSLALYNRNSPGLKWSRIKIIYRITGFLDFFHCLVF
jgi:hypothetical protein